jgi:hypothetical protein
MIYHSQNALKESPRDEDSFEGFGYRYIECCSGNSGVGERAAVPYKAPRATDKQPNLNGIWQAINTANRNIQGHSARLSLVVAPWRRGRCAHEVGCGGGG